jgi:hypothetical protein
VSDTSSTPSIADLVQIHGAKHFQRMIYPRWPYSQEVFITQLYEILDEVIRRVEEDADVHRTADEVAISRTVVRQLQQAGYSASAETPVRGHVDILVNSADGTRCWIGESKIHRKYEDLTQALLQLISRYATGRDPDGGLLILVKHKGCDEVLKRWRKHLQTVRTEGLIRTERDVTPRCFRSVHEHDSGAEYCVRHMGVHLYYAPRDESGQAGKR